MGSARCFGVFAAAVCACLAGGVAARVPTAAARPAPRAALPDTPADGSGVYRLNLDQALGPAPLTLVIEIRGGRAIAAAALPLRSAQCWCPVDASGLKLENDRLTGAAAVEYPTVFQPKLHRRFIEGKPNAGFEPYLLKTALRAAYTLDAACHERSGAGSWTAAWSGDSKANPLGPFTKRHQKGALTLTREPARVPRRPFQCDLYLHAALGDLTFADRQPTPPAVWLRAEVGADAAPRLAGHAALGGKLEDQPARRLRFDKAEFVLHEDASSPVRLNARLGASVEGVDDSAFSLEIEGRAIGRRLVGVAAARRGEATVVTQWVGLLHEAPAWPLPLEVLPASWEWEHDQAADAALAARAAAESLEPVMPGEPGKTGFWTWRKLTPHAPVSTIHPPCFDLRPVEGAAAYRFEISGGPDKKTLARFTADQPWRSLAPAWKDLPAGGYSLVVVPLDAAGQALPGPMRMGVLEKTTARPGIIEAASLPLVKRPAFAGPYAAAPADWPAAARGAALAIGRWHRAHPGLHERRGLGLSPSGNAWTTGGDHGYGVAVADRVWCALATRDLTPDPAERQFAEEMLAFNLEDLELHQRFNKPEGYIHDYQGDTPLAYWIGSALIDASVATGDPRWREAALKLGRALVAQQKPNGAFYSPLPDIRDPKTRRGPHGYFTWREGAIEFGAAELLWLFGRMRVDLGVDEFAEAETKARQWVMEHGVRERFWPINVSHSMSTGYPIWQHPVAALCFCRHLLELAPAERRDVKLAAEVARWAEDVGVDWRRAPPGKQTGPITPHINAIDRYNNEPVAVNLLAAIVCERLFQATGDPLWAAKGEALATAVLQGAEPGTGRPASGLVPNVENHCSIARGYVDPAHYRHWDFCNGWAASLWRDYADARAERAR